MGMLSLFRNSETIYFPGCYSSAFLNNKINNYKRILNKLDIDFKFQKEFFCCGGFLEESGYEKKLRKLAKENFEKLQDQKTKKIITNCPLCMNTLKSYKELVPNWNINPEFILTTILNKLKEKKEGIRNYFSEPIVYYDSCYLSRYLQITQEPREILQILGYKLVELNKNKEETICSGACGGLPETNSELAEKIAINLIKTLKKQGIKKLVTIDSRDYTHLKKALEKIKISQEELGVYEFSDLLCDSLGVEKE
jgi:Fe-S oxidoreductase